MNKKDVDEASQLSSGVKNELNTVGRSGIRSGLPANMINVYKKFVRGAYITDNFKWV